MTDRIKSLLDRTFGKEQRIFRRDVDWKPLLERFAAEGTPDEARARIGLEEMLKAETPAFMDGERIAFLRTVKQIPDLHSDKEMEARRAQGVAFGTASHVVGTSRATELGQLQGAVSSLSLVIAGLMTAVLFPVLTSFL